MTNYKYYKNSHVKNQSEIDSRNKSKSVREQSEQVRRLHNLLVVARSDSADCTKKLREEFRYSKEQLLVFYRRRAELNKQIHDLERQIQLLDTREETK